MTGALFVTLRRCWSCRECQFAQNLTVVRPRQRLDSRYPRRAVSCDGRLDGGRQFSVSDGSAVIQEKDTVIFYNQPIALGGALHLREKVRSDEKRRHPTPLLIHRSQE
jgi:hypothetical protein